MSTELVDVKVDIPSMFMAQQTYDCIINDELLQKELQDGCLIGEYRSEKFMFTSQADFHTLHLDRAIFTIREIYISPTNPDELRMMITFDDYLSYATELLYKIYKTDARLVSFVVRGLCAYNMGNGTHTIDRVVTIDGMLNNPRTYYNTEGGCNRASGLRAAELPNKDDPKMIVPYWLFR